MIPISILEEFSSNQILGDTKFKDGLWNEITVTKAFLTTTTDFLILYKNSTSLSL